jgi:hypothetical protein
MSETAKSNQSVPKNFKSRAKVVRGIGYRLTVWALLEVLSSSRQIFRLH